MSLRLGAIVLDAPDPQALAAFYSRLLDWPVAPGDSPWVRLTAPDGGTDLEFHRAEQAAEPVWPDPAGPALVHIDVEVPSREALAAEHERVIALGARPLTDHPEPGEAPFRVYADPAGHPFCLCAC